MQLRARGKTHCQGLVLVHEAPNLAVPTASPILLRLPALTQHRSLGNVTQETDMTDKWGLEKLLNAEGSLELVSAS